MLRSRKHLVLWFRLVLNFRSPDLRLYLNCRLNSEMRISCTGLKDVCNMDGVRCSTIYPEKFGERESLWKPGNSDDDMCQMDYEDDLMFGDSMNYSSKLTSHDLNKVIIDSRSFLLCCVG